MKTKSLWGKAALLWGMCCLPMAVGAQLPLKVESYPVTHVRLKESPFKHAEQMDICYLLGLDADRLLAPYLKEAGLPPKAPNYTNWEDTGLDGHIGGHYLSALSYMYASTGDARIREWLHYTLSELKRCQEAAGDGYLCGVPHGRQVWKEISEGNIRASGFGLNDRWVPLYNIHKIYGGLRDAYVQAGVAEAKKMLVALTDWMERVVSNLTNEQMQDMLRSEHGGLNEVFADVAELTGNPRYLKLAHSFSHREILEPLLRGEDNLTGMHANTQIPKVIGFKRIADLEGNAAWNEGVRFFWNTVVNHRSVSIGGNSVREHFHPADDFDSMLHSEQGPETCNTYNMLRLTKMLYATDGAPSYMDYYERALYNHILSTQNPVQGGFVYFTPMRAGHYRVYSQPQTSFWCCVGSGLENHARYGEMIYGHRGDDLYVHLFIPSVLRDERRGLTLTQENNFPEEEATSLTFDLKKPKRFTLRIRSPHWVNPGGLRLMLNGASVPMTVEDGYVSLTRTWSKGDRVHLELPMHLRAEGTPDGKARYSFLYGPLVLAANMGVQGQQGLYADDSRGGHIAAGELLPADRMPVLVGEPETLLTHLHKVEGKPLTFALNGVSPAALEGLELIPFNRLHECRYMIYFPLISEHDLLLREEQLAREERERMALDSRTVDKVVCGEQQPESDRFIRMEKAHAGADNGVHWRETSGWFAYRMKTDDRPVTEIRVVCRADEHRDARLLLDGKEVGRISGTQAVHTIVLPDAWRGTTPPELRVEQATSPVSLRICEIRLLTR